MHKCFKEGVRLQLGVSHFPKFEVCYLEMMAEALYIVYTGGNGSELRRKFESLVALETGS